MAEVTALFRYPIKGLSAEPLAELTLARNAGLAFDREFALALGTTAFDPQHPEPLDKGFFLMLRSNEVMATLTTRFEPETGLLTVKWDGQTVLTEDVTTEATRGRPRLVRAAGHKFTDGSVISPAFMRAVSLINLASIRALEERTGTPIHPLRFRANIYVDGLAPWEELGWVGREVSVGGLRLRGLARTPRCAAIDVNPETAERDTHLPKALKRHFGHVDLGIYLEVLADGTLAVGDRLELVPEDSNSGT